VRQNEADPQVVATPRAGEAEVLDRTASIIKANNLTQTESTAAGLRAEDDGKPTATRRANAKSWRDVFKVHLAADLFPMMSKDELLVLGNDIKKNGLKVPITLWQETNLSDQTFVLDGRNRLDAMELVGLDVVTKTPDGKDVLAIPKAKGAGANWRCTNHVFGVTVFHTMGLNGGRISRPRREYGTNPYEFVLSANIHRRHLTVEEKRDLIANVLKATPEKSNRQIAEMVKASHPTVAKVRREEEATGNVLPVEKTIGGDGKARKKPAKKQRSTEEDFKRDLAAKNTAAAVAPTPPAEIIRDIIAPDEELALLREFARFVIGRSVIRVSNDPKHDGDLAEWKLLLGRVRAVLS
jgi:hypothetical protein